MVRREVDREHVEDDIEGTIGVQIEVTNEAKGTFPCGAGASFNGLSRLDRVSGGRGMRRS